MSVRTFLDRFRPAGGPGAATGAAVPGDRVASVSAELAPVFDALAATVEQCVRIREEARAEATRRTGRADEQARAAIGRAAVEAEAARLPSGAAAAASRLLDEAVERARQLRIREDARRAELVAVITARVRERVGRIP